MPELDDVIRRLRGYATGGRGVPTDTGLPNTGRYGGYPGWEPGMPRAPGNSPSPSGRFGGTYTPSGNAPVPPVGSLPTAVNGGGVSGMPPRFGSGVGISGLKGPGPVPVLNSPDIGSPRHTPQEMIDWLMKRNASPQSSNGGAMMPVPIPPAAATPAPARPIPNATGNLPVQLVSAKDQDRPPAPSFWSESAQMPRGPVVPARVPLPTPRPQVPLPRPRPQMPVPAPRPQMARPAPANTREAQNQSILDTLLSSFDPNAEWRQQYR